MTTCEIHGHTIRVRCTILLQYDVKGNVDPARVIRYEMHAMGSQLVKYAIRVRRTILLQYDVKGMQM